MKGIYVGAGGFWITEAVYRKVKGVTEVIPGYMGGTIAHPTHELVATGTTGHVEVVKVTYDETVISLEEVLDIFFALHDPAAPNHITIGPGSQYRAVIFYTDDSEGEAANPENGEGIGIIPRVMEKVQATMPEGVIVSTHVMSAQEFYAAHEDHYSYYGTHQDDAYSVTVIRPKLEIISKKFPDKFFGFS